MKIKELRPLEVQWHVQRELYWSPWLASSSASIFCCLVFNGGGMRGGLVKFQQAILSGSQLETNEHDL